VAKYRIAEDTFRETWKIPTVSIDLGRLSLDQAEVDRRAATAPPLAVYCIGSKAYLLADQLLKDRALVLSSAINWQRFPARANRLVIANEVPAASQLTLFRYVFPRLPRIGVLYSRKYGERWMNEAVQLSKDSQHRIEAREVNKAAELTAALQDLLPQVDALWLVADPVVLSGAAAVREIFEQARAAKKPVFAYSPIYAELGAALIVAPDDATIGRQAAALLLARGAGEPPRDSVQSPAGSEVTLNLRVIQDYKIEFNAAALDSVNHVIRQDGRESP
jgi:putative ABC transport system substrate-binding protein